MEPEPPAPLSSAPSQVLPECIQAELGVLPLKSLYEGFGLFWQHYNIRLHEYAWQHSPKFQRFNRVLP